MLKCAAEFYQSTLALFNLQTYQINQRYSKVEYYPHTNRFCVVQENIKPEVLEVQTEFARSVH